MKNCEIIRDLLPLYVDELTSPESNALIETHLETCPVCRMELERMRRAASLPEDAQTQNINYKKALKSQLRRMKLKITGTTLASVLIAVAIVLLMLWWNGVFCIIDRQTSPDKNTVLTVYNRNVTDPLHSDNTFSIREKSSGSLFSYTTSIYSGSYVDLSWSADGQYCLIEKIASGDPAYADGSPAHILNGKDISGCPLDLMMYGTMLEEDAFANVPWSSSDVWPINVSYNFIHWSEYGHSMLFYYTFVDTEGIDRAGYFWYTYIPGTDDASPTGNITGLVEIPFSTARGQIKSSGTHQDGSAFYVMNLAEPDGNSNTVEFVFTVTGTTDIRNTQALKDGDYVIVVYQENETLTDFPAISVTRTTADYSVKHKKTYGDP